MREQSHVRGAGSRVFGVELRRRRIAAGRTIAQLAAEIHYSKAQISKIETGGKRPTAEVARLCDKALDAEGELRALVPPPERAGAGAEEVSPSRRAVALGAVGVLGAGVAVPLPQDGPGDGTLLDVTRGLFEQYRGLGQVLAPEAVLPLLAEQTRLLRHLASRNGTKTARGLLVLASRYLEFAGWMAQESGDDAAAARWTDQAVELAEAAGDHDLAAYALVRRALMAFYRGDAATTVQLTHSARAERLPARIKGLAAQLEAQGHALAGDEAAFGRSLDAARHWLAVPDGDDGPVLGTTNLADPAEMASGWSLLDLGRPHQAAEVLDAQCARIPARALRTQARYGIRRALAHAVAGNVDHACDVARPLLGTAGATGSATVLLDVRRLSRTLARFRTRRSVRELAPELAGALHSPR